MKKDKLVISDQAVADLNEIWLYIATDSPRAADNFLELLYETCQALKEQPEAGRARDELYPGIRSLVVKSYLIFYRVKETSVEIIRIVSGYRDLDFIF